MRVNRSTYYKHFFSPVAPRVLENQDIRGKILTLYARSDKRLSAQKMRCCLKTEYGIQISVGRVYRLMRGMQLPKMSTAKPAAAYKKKSEQDDTSCRNILQQNFNPQEPNRVWASDITYVRTEKGFNYVCVVLDLFSRKVIAWRASNKADARLVMETAEEAYLNRGRPQSVLFHSDRGCQYTAELFRRFSDQKNIVQSFSAPGYPYDNAVVESFFKFFKKEELNRRHFRNLEEVKRSAFVYIEGFYNPKRPHSANNNLSPDQKEENFKNRTALK